VRVCDLTGQLAGAGATRFLAAFGAQVIRVEDPMRQGRWDILRGSPPFVDERRGVDLGGAFNNHNVEKLGVTLNLRTERGREVFAELVRISDVVSENFAAGVMKRMGFDYERLAALRPDVIYVSNCGFGHTGPYQRFKTWGPIVQAVCGLTFSSGRPDAPPAGWGYSYMDHTGAYYMCLAILMALYHRARTGEGQWIDMACTEAGATLTGTDILDFSANGRRARRPGQPHSSRSRSPVMVPHGIYPARGEDAWIALACRDDADFEALAGAIGEPWARDPRYRTLAGRLECEDELDASIGRWTAQRDKFEAAARVRAAGVPASAVQKPDERIDRDENTRSFGLWPTVKHTAMGDVRVDGLGARLSETDWAIERGGPCLGEHNEYVFGELLGLSGNEIARLREQGVI